MTDARDHFDHVVENTLYAMRHYLAQVLREKTGSVVQYGILRGYEVGPSHWAEPTVGAYLLGTYESHVCALLDILKSPEKVLIDLGAADGLFGIGLVAVGAYGQSVCFEADESRAQYLRDTIARLGLEERVGVRGTATAKALEEAVRDLELDLRESVVLCDIEGAEFELFGAEMLETLSDSHVIIETHDFLLKDPESRATALSALKARAAEWFDVYELHDGLRDLRDVPLLAGWTEANTWIACLEGRRRLMTWLYLAPRGQSIVRMDQIDSLVLAYQKSIFQ